MEKIDMILFLTSVCVPSLQFLLFLLFLHFFPQTMSHFKITFDSNNTEYVIRIPAQNTDTNANANANIHMKFVYTEDGEEISYRISNPDDVATVHMKFP